MPDTMSAALSNALASPESKDLDLEWKVQRGDGGGYYEAKVNLAGIVSADDDTGVVDALVSVTGLLDEVEDVILPGAYANTLTKRVPKGVWSHDWSTWVSRTDKVAELLPDDPSLPRQWKGKPWPKNAGAARVRTAFNLGTQAGKDAYSNVVFFDAGPLGQQVEWSIGYRVVAGKSTRTSQGWRLIKELDWFEYCPVLFGAMPLAGTLASKERKSAEGAEGKERERIEVSAPPAGSIAEQVERAVKALQQQDEPRLAVVDAGWTPTDEELAAEHKRWAETKVAGREVTPGDVEATDRLKHYWTHGTGGAKIQWGVPGDFNRCVTELAKFMHDPGEVKGYCALRHHEATGAWPGHAATEQVGGHRGGDHGHKGHPMGTEQQTGTTFVDDDPDDELALALDPEDPDYPTEQPGDADGDGDEDGEDVEGKALETKASGKMKCGKSAADCPHTMPDDSYPVHDADEVGKAVTAYPRGAGSGKSKSDIRAHIVTRAKAVGAMKKVPNTWPEKREGKGAEDAIAEALESKDYPALPGSVEERQTALNAALNDLLLPEPDANGNVRAYVSLDGTYADRAVATLSDYSVDPSQRQTFVVPYTVDDDGEVALGTPQPYDKVVQLVPAAKADVGPGSDSDTDGDGTTTGAGAGSPATGANPLRPFAVKLADQAKALLDAFDALGPDDDPARARVLRKAAEAMTGALGVCGVPVPAEPEQTEAKGADVDDEDLMALAVAAETLLADV